MEKRALDLAIAKKLFGHRVVENKRPGKPSYWTEGPAQWIDIQGDLQLTNCVPYYSTDLTIACGILEELDRRKISWTLESMDGVVVYLTIGETLPFCKFSSTSIPETICRATLDYLEQQKGKRK